MADVTEQMSNQGVLWIVVNLHNEFGQGMTTGRIPVERGDTSIPEWRIDIAGMTDVPEPMICPIMEERGTVWLDTLDTLAKSVKEHLSIVICGYVGSGKRTATRRILFDQGGIPEIERDELTQETVRLEKSPFARAFDMEATKDAGYIYGTNVLWFINELTTTEITYRLDKKDVEEVDILTDDTSGGTFDVSLIMIVDDISDEEATTDKGEHERPICDKFYKFNLESCTEKLCEECTKWCSGSSF